jgi:hypothetical protein
MKLRHEQLAALVLMGPSARHIEESTLFGKIAGLESPLRVTGAVNLHVYEPAKHLRARNRTEGSPEKAVPTVGANTSTRKTAVFAKGVGHRSEQAIRRTSLPLRC